MQHFYSFVPQACHWWCPPFSTDSIHLSPRSLLLSALFCWPCSISIHLFLRSVTASVRPFPLAKQHFYSFVPQACHWWCPPFSAVSIHLSPRSVLVSALFCWPCSISIHLFLRSVAASVRPFPLAMQHVYSSQVCHCSCPPLSVGHAAFLFMCLPGLSLVVSALFRWPCSIPILLSPRSVSVGVRPFPLAMQHFYSFVSQVSALFRWPCSISIPGSVTGAAALFRWPCSISIHLFPM